MVKISKNEYFHNLVRIAYLFGFNSREKFEKVRDAYPTNYKIMPNGLREWYYHLRFEFYINLRRRPIIS